MKAAFDYPATQAYTCPDHGEYELHAPPAIVEHWCPTCAQLHQAARENATEAYREQRHRFELWNAAGIPRKYQATTFENFIPASSAQEKAYDTFVRYSANPRARVESGTGLLVIGPPGVGKTHLIASTVTAACAAGVPALYTVWAEAIERVKATFDGNRDHPDRDLLERLARVPLLVLDELGGASSEFERRRLFDARYRESLPIVAATNLTPSTLHTLGERTADRLREMCLMVPITGQSQRGTPRAAAHKDPAMSIPETPEVSRRVCVNGQMVSKSIRIE